MPSHAGAASPSPAAEKPANSTAATAGRDPSFAFVNFDQLYQGVGQAKDAEAKLEQEKAATEKEYKSRIVDYQKQQAELPGLNQRLAAMKADDPAREELVRQRDSITSALQTKEREINEFRIQREREVQGKSASLRDPVLADVRGAMSRVGKNVNLLFDTSGRSLSGIPFIVVHPISGDITQRLSPALQGKDPASLNSMRGLKVATVDMNKVFTQLKRTKDAETKLNASRVAAQQENERRVNAIKEERAKADTLSGPEKEKQASKARMLESELNDFRVKKSAELNQEMVNAGQPILAEMATALGKIAGDKAALVFDSTGMSTAGVPLLLWSKDLPDFSADLTALLNGDAKAGKTEGVASASLRFGLLDLERVYNALPDAKQAETEINEAMQRASAELANADATARAEKQQQLQNLARSKRQAALNKLTGALNSVATAGQFNAVFDTSGKTQSNTPPVVAASDVPDLTEQVIAKFSGSGQ
jgi:Skp family chaperone for outer membrane proteins